MKNNFSNNDKVKYLGEIGIKWFVAFALLILVTNYLSVIHIAAFPNWDTDYKYFYLSAAQLLKHENLYDPHLFFEGVAKQPVVNLNTPLVALLVVPLSFVSYQTSFWVWSLLNLTLTLLSIFLIGKKLFQPKSFFFACLVCALLTFSYFPNFLNVYCGQMGAVVFFFITLGWLFYREKRMSLGSFIWGIAFSMKLFVGLFLLLFLVRKEWRNAQIFLLTGVTCFLLGFLFFDTTIYLNYSRIFEKVQWYASSGNVSLFGFFTRIFGFHEQNIALIDFPQLTLVFYVLSVGFLLFTFFFFRGSISITPQNEKLASDLAVSYTIVCMLLISPLGWIYYFSLLFVPFAVIFYWNQRVFHKTLLHPFLAFILFCSSIPHLLLKPHQITQISNIFLQASFYSYALFLLAAIIFKLNLVFINRGSKQSAICEPKVPLPNWILIALYITALFPSFMGILNINSLLVMAK